VGLELAMDFWGEAMNAENAGFLEVISVDIRLEQAGVEVLSRFSKEKLSFVDGVSMAVMVERKIDEVFGFDRHFYLIGVKLVP